MTSASPATLRRASPSGTDDRSWRKGRNNTGGCPVPGRDAGGGHSSSGFGQRALVLRRCTYACPKAAENGRVTQQHEMKELPHG